MKAVTHHTTPLKQFLYTDSLEALPGDYSQFDAAKLTPNDCAPVLIKLKNSYKIFSAKVVMMGRLPSSAGISKRRWNNNTGSSLALELSAVSC